MVVAPVTAIAHSLVPEFPFQIRSHADLRVERVRDTQNTATNNTQITWPFMTTYQFVFANLVQTGRPRRAMGAEHWIATLGAGARGPPIEPGTDICFNSICGQCPPWRPPYFLQPLPYYNKATHTNPRLMNITIITIEFNNLSMLHNSLIVTCAIIVFLYRHFSRWLPSHPRQRWIVYRQRDLSCKSMPHSTITEPPTVSARSNDNNAPAYSSDNVKSAATWKRTA